MFGRDAPLPGRADVSMAAIKARRMQQCRLARSGSNTVVTVVLLLNEMTRTMADLQHNAKHKAPKTTQILYS